MSGENHIEEVRKGIRAAFSEQNLIPENGGEFVSPNGQYKIKQTVYQQAVDDLNWQVSKIEVIDHENNLVSSFLIDDHNFFHHWILSGEKEYLLFAENLCGGNSVLNLKTREVRSYSDGTDGFISADYYPSPDLKHLAIVGCYWACPYEVQVFDISNIELLPWPMILETELNGGEGDVVWLDDNTFRISTPPGKTPESSRNVVIPNAGGKT